MDFQPSAPIGSPLSPVGEKKSNLTHILLIIAAVLVVLVLWVWFYGGNLFPLKEKSQVPTPTIGVKSPAEPDVAALQNQSFSDDASVIENDLNATDLGNLDLELKAIDNELAQ